jgi:hypothetical protein
MKKKLPLLLLIFAFTCVEANSQKTHFGLTFGINSAKGVRTHSGTYIGNEDFQSGTGFSVGVYAEVPLKHNIFFQPSIIFIRKNTNVTSQFSSTKTSGNVIELNLNYLYRPFKEIGFLFGAGPSFSLGSYSEQYTSLDYIFYYNKTTSSFNLGYGVNFLAKYEFNHQLAIGSNYNLDLQAINRGKCFGFNIQYSF